MSLKEPNVTLEKVSATVTVAPAADDEAELARMGYTQELR